MKYMGSKRRIAKEIIPIMLKDYKKGQIFYDLFAGGFNLIDKIPDNIVRVANDSNKYLIALFKELQKDTFTFPEHVGEDKYKHIQKNKDLYPDWLVGYVGFNLSFAAKFFGGYRRDKAGVRNYENEAQRNLKAQQNLIKNIEIYNLSYDEVPLKPDSIIYCFDKDSECLTKDGWKNVKDITLDDYCFSREPNTRKLEWVKVDKLVNYHYNGKMYKYEDKNIDIMTTPNHRLFINKPKTRNKIYEDGFIEADDAFNSNFRFVSAGGIWDGNKENTINICDTIFNKKDFAYLLGIFITDGSINKQGIITISQSKPNIIDKIKSCLQILKIPISIYDNNRDNVKTFYIPKKYLPFFKQFYLKENRKIPTEFKESSIDILNSLIEGIIDGDGSENRRVILGSKTLVDDIQEICYKIGLSSNYRIIKPKYSYLKNEDRYINATKDYYIISINHKPYLSHFHKNESYIDYDDMVYCFELEKWHTVLIRRNGKIIWNGQCDIPYKNTTNYNTSKNFDYDKFYEWCIEKHKEGHNIFISEYYMPEDKFKCIWEKEINSSLTKDTGAKKGVEKLFTPL